MMYERELITSKSDIFVPEGQEDEYCRKHNIEFRRLPNGAVILGTPRKVEDKMHATVEFIFPTGAYFDPPGRSGLHHFLEHIITNGPAFRAIEDHRHVSARASVETFTLLAPNNAANSGFPDYGIWPSLHSIREILDDPFLLIPEAILHF